MSLQFANGMNIGGTSGGATIRNQDKTITTNGEYTADTGYTGLGTVTVEVEGGATTEELTVTPTTTTTTYTPSEADAYSKVTVNGVTSAIDSNIKATNIKSGVSILGVSGSVTELNADTLSVTPTTSAQTLTPTSPKNGYSQVNVSAVTSAIDANITAGNIKSGVQILGVTGSYSGGSANIDSLSITPTTSEQTITASGGVDGYSPITVSGVTSSIDNNIVAGNIKKDVTILGVTGSLESGITPTGSLPITENGTYDVTNYASAVVNVSGGGGGEDIATKYAFSVATFWKIDSNGDLYGAGNGTYGQQGNNNSGSNAYEKEFTKRLSDVAKIYCSNNTTWAIKTDGTLWGCGDGQYGQQGSGSQGSGHVITTFTQRLTEVAKVFCCNESTWALKTDGKLYRCGKNDSGQLGNGSANNITTFELAMSDVKEVFLGTYESPINVRILKTDGTLWGSGSNNRGQLFGTANPTSTTYLTQITTV